MSPLLSCDDTCRIWWGFKESRWNLNNFQSFRSEDINQRSYSAPHTWILVPLDEIRRLHSLAPHVHVVRTMGGRDLLRSKVTWVMGTPGRVQWGHTREDTQRSGAWKTGGIHGINMKGRRKLQGVWLQQYTVRFCYDAVDFLPVFSRNSTCEREVSTGVSTATRAGKAKEPHLHSIDIVQTWIFNYISKSKVPRCEHWRCHAY